MPNTLAHIGLQTPLTKLGIKQAPLQWIVLGCIIPDIPWIVQRVLSHFPAIDPLCLRLYSATQASFVYCLILSLAVAILATKSRQVFCILASNSLIHLLLDACQTKWGNGVHFLAPLSWDLTNFGFIWPEHLLFSFLSFAGLAVLILLWPKAIRYQNLLQRPGPAQTTTAIFLLASYLCSPALFLNDAYAANIHYAKTLDKKETRKGDSIALDRSKYNAATNTLACYSGITIHIANAPELKSGILSIHGRFLDDSTVRLDSFHEHSTARDYFSYAGLVLTLLLWAHTYISQKPANMG